MPSTEPQQEGRGAAWCLFAFTLWQSFLSGGIVYGWPALLVILKQEGVYASKCGSDVEPGVECSARSVALNLIFTIGAMTNPLGGAFAGFFSSPKIAMIVGVAMVGTGSFLFGVSDSSSGFIWPLGFLLMGVGGGMAHLPCMCLGNAFGSMKGGIIACFVGCFCASTLTFQIMNVLYINLGFSRQVLFLLHAGLECVNICVTAWLWPHVPIKPGGGLAFRGGRMEVIDPNQTAATPIQPAPLRRVIEVALSKPVLCFLIFHTSQLLFNRCLLGWLDSELEWRNEINEEAGLPLLNRRQHMSVFTILEAFVGLTAIPVFGVIVARFGHSKVPTLITGLLSIVWLTFFMIQSEWPLYIVYIFCSLHRQFFFSTFFHYLASEFPPTIFPKLTGLANCGAGLASGLQTPLLQVTLNCFDGNFLPMNTILLCWGYILALGAVWNFFRGDNGDASSPDKWEDVAPVDKLRSSADAKFTDERFDIQGIEKDLQYKIGKAASDDAELDFESPGSNPKAALPFAPKASGPRRALGSLFCLCWPGARGPTATNTA